MEKPCLFGETPNIDLTDKKGLSAPYLETKLKSSRLSFCEKLTPLLISAGLVRGIIPMSIRGVSGAQILDFASFPLAGHVAEFQKKES